MNHIPNRLRRTLRSGADLAAAGIVAPDRIAEIDRVAARYSVAITPALLDLIDTSDAADPIARQFVPDAAELDSAPGEQADPIGDLSHSPVKGIVHRYPDRVLLTPLLTCPVYCRYCFRRERVGQEKALTESELSAALDYIRARDEVWEVILTGGDPLMLSPERIRAIVAALNAIPHVRTIRIHSRVPVADPARVTPELVAVLDGEKPIWIAVHCNHARELSPEARAACLRLAKSGIPLVGQTVLLKGVNDDAATLEALFRAMVESRIKPYYLHHLDAAPGTGHFRTSIAEGQALMRSLRGRVSGLCQPDYVLDIPGGHGKAPIGPTYLHGDEIEDWRGGRHHLGNVIPAKAGIHAPSGSPLSRGDG
jgi:lysine 2,3-aminomutase